MCRSPSSRYFRATRRKRWKKQVTIPLGDRAERAATFGTPVFAYQFGLSFIYITFDDAVNDYFARQQVLERMQNADLPDGVKPAMGPLASPVGEIYRFLPEERYALRHRVARDSGLDRGAAVEDRTRRGRRGEPRRLHQAIPGGPKPERALKSYGLTMSQIFTALQRGNANAGGGVTLKQGAQQYLNPRSGAPAVCRGHLPHRGGRARPVCRFW